MKAEAYDDAVYDKDARKCRNTMQRISNNKANKLINRIKNVLGEQNIADIWQEHFRNYIIQIPHTMINYILNYILRSYVKSIWIMWLTCILCQYKMNWPRWLKCIMIKLWGLIAFQLWHFAMVDIGWLSCFVVFSICASTIATYFFSYCSHY